MNNRKCYSNVKLSVRKSADLKLALNTSEHVSLQTLLRLCSVRLWSWCTFQGLQHAVGGVSQERRVLLHLRHSFRWCSSGSTCPPRRSLGFQEFQLFQQSGQVLNTSVGTRECEVYTDRRSWSRFYLLVEPCQRFPLTSLPAAAALSAASDLSWAPWAFCRTFFSRSFSSPNWAVMGFIILAASSRFLSAGFSWSLI